MYLPERDLVVYLLKRDYYRTYFSYIDLQHLRENYKELHYLYVALKELHEQYPDKDLDLNALQAMFFFKHQDADKEIYLELFKTLQETPLDEDVGVGLLKAIKQRKQALDLSQAAMQFATGYGDLDKVLLLSKEIENETEVVEDEIEVISDDLEYLVNESVMKSGLRWRLDCLNKSLGSLRKGDFGFIFARPESYSRDTEVLTPNGWLTVDQVTTDTLIAQVNTDRQLTFVKPTAVHPHEQEFCYHIHDTVGRVDLIVTEGHAMVLDKGKGLYKERADTVIYYQGIKHHVAASIKNEVEREFTAMDALNVAFQADGHTRIYQARGGHTFSFVKERKIKRLSNILNECGLKFTTYKDGNCGHIGFYTKVIPHLHKNFDWINLEEVSVQWCRDFIEELSYWDATRRTNQRYKFDTTDRAVADKVQAIAILAGYNCLLSEFPDNRKETFKTIYSLSIRTNYKPIDGQSIIKERIPFTDTTYCFEVPDGMLLVRRNGATAVCGNTGKTTFLASEISHMLTQLKDDKPIVWFNMEEQGNKVMLRVYQAYFGVKLEQLLSNPSKYKAEFQKQVQGRFKLVDNANLDKHLAERLIRTFNPSLIVYDVIDKIKGFDSDREDLRLGSIYQWARELAKVYAPSIGICQADGSGENTKWLSMANVSSAKTSKQSEADFIVGIGKIHAEGAENVRYLNLSKNKLAGDSDSISDLRHAHLETFIEPETARYKDIMKFS